MWTKKGIYPNRLWLRNLMASFVFTYDPRNYKKITFE